MEHPKGSHLFKSVPVIGITGGTGSGKSVVANVFKHLGAFVIDADAVGKNILEYDLNVNSEVIKMFGGDVVSTDGTINRKRLAEKVFNNPSNLKLLNGIIHPPMIRFIEGEAKKAIRSQKYPMIAIDAALIFEAGVESKFDYVITVTAETERRIQWLQNRGFVKREEVTARINSQLPQEKKLSRSDFVLENNGTIEDLEEKAQQLFHTVLEEFSVRQ